MKKWIFAFRLRTLPLALSSILMGNFLAAWQEAFSWSICILTVLTTVFLQILSNLANDYGDSVHGADSEERKGPKRAVQTGEISSTHMKMAIYVFSGLSLISGVRLLLISFPGQWIWVMVFLAFGLAAIYAAITYTAGKNPYGYAGLGDISVFLFFGLLGVLGSNFLQTKTFEWLIILPAISCGLLATGVLNVNNIRDIESDEKAGKRSIPVRIGRNAAVVYHGFLIFLAIGSAFIFMVLNLNGPWQFLFLLTLPLLVKNFISVKSKKLASELDPFLKQLALSTLLFVVLFGLGLFL